MSVTLNEGALGDLLRSTYGPVGRDIARRTASVYDDANANASGLVIGVRSTDLISSIRARIEETEDGPTGIVGSNAHHRGFLYPLIVTRAEDNEPGGWLIRALDSGFRRNGA